MQEVVVNKISGDLLDFMSFLQEQADKETFGKYEVRDIHKTIERDLDIEYTQILLDVSIGVFVDLICNYLLDYDSKEELRNELERTLIINMSFKDKDEKMITVTCSGETVEDVIQELKKVFSNHGFTEIT